MEFPKVSLIAVCAISLFSCSTYSPEMSAADQLLFEQSLRTSMMQEGEGNLSYYTVLPKDLNQALASYQDMVRFGGMHDFDYLQELGLRFLEQSKGEFDPEAQLLSVYGASLAKNHKLLPLLEKALASQHPQVQLASIRALADYHDDAADRILLKGLGSNYLEVCFETVYMLAVNKHPDALGYIEALMHRIPEQFHYLFPTLYAIVDTPQSSKILKKFLQNRDPAVSSEAILSAARLARFDLIEDIRSISYHHSLAEQEACAFTLGHLQDEQSISRIEELSKSPSEHVALAALQALYRLGRREVVEEIESYAQKGNLFAIHMLRECQCDEKLLEALSYHTQQQVRLNASLALLKKKNSLCLSEVRNILIPKDTDVLILPTQSPGKALSANKYTIATQSVLRANPFLREISNQAKREILMECVDLPESAFLTLAQEIIDANQNDLIPIVIQLVESLKTTNSIAILKEWQQKVGSPFVRAWSNLALFHLDQPGPWKENILSWIKKQKYHPMIRLRPIVPFSKKPKSSHFELTPEEKSQLLIESYLAIALRQEEGGLEVILSHLSSQSAKNKYALAGILIKATE